VTIDGVAGMTIIAIKNGVEIAMAMRVTDPDMTTRDLST